MTRILLALCMMSVAVGSAAAEGQAKAKAKAKRDAPIVGCNYVGPLNCRYIRTTTGKVYQLAPNWGVAMPPPDRIVRVTGVIRPKTIGFCSASEILRASKIETGGTCRHLRKR